MTSPLLADRNDYALMTSGIGLTWSFTIAGYATGKGAALARYALEGLPNKIMATEYLTALPPHELLEAELDRTRRILSQGTQFAT
jgi:hypothetical protein